MNTRFIYVMYRRAEHLHMALHVWDAAIREYRKRHR